jgi:hypothetical protein
MADNPLPILPEQTQRDSSQSTSSLGSLLPKAPLGSRQWDAEWKELEAEREKSKVYQLAFWDDDKRAMPTDFVACALFAALHGKNTQYLRGEYIACINGYTVTYTGKRLTQVHADIVMGALHLMRGRPQGDKVEFRVRPFLRLIGRHTGKTDRDSFRQLIDDVIATAVRITKPDGKLSYSGSILAKAKDVTVGDDTLFVLEVHREIAKLFESGFGTIDWEKRKALMRQPLCLWLQLYFSKFGTRPVAVAELHRLSGSTAPLKKFRQNLRAALSVLESKGVVAAWIDPATDSVRREHRVAASPIKVPASPSPQQQAALPLAPAITPRAKAEFCKLYPDHDAEACARSFTDWLSRKGRTANNPDAAFLGFADKWVKSVSPAAQGEPRHQAT